MQNVNFQLHIIYKAQKTNQTKPTKNENQLDHNICNIRTYRRNNSLCFDEQLEGIMCECYIGIGDCFAE